MKYYSQFSQDKLIDKILKKKEHGFFVDIGANDGISGSNSYFFEKFRKWNGIGIEPNPLVYEKYLQNRKSDGINAAVSRLSGEMEFMQCEGYTEMLSGLIDSYDASHIQRIEKEIKQHGGSYRKIKVPCFTLNEILTKANVTEVDYCSIDTEGNESEIIKSINFSKFSFNVFSIEWNYGSQKEITNFFKQKNFAKVCTTGCDIIFVNKSTIKLFPLYRDFYILKSLIWGNISRFKNWIKERL